MNVWIEPHVRLCFMIYIFLVFHININAWKSDEIFRQNAPLHYIWEIDFSCAQRVLRKAMWKENFYFNGFFFHLDADCKRTPEGIEYLGQTNTTSDGKGCQSWENALSTSLPYGSHKSNVNYCRTATRLAHQQMNFMGMPWCYDIEGTSQACNITYCGKTLGPVSISEKTSFRKIS